MKAWEIGLSLLLATGLLMQVASGGPVFPPDHPLVQAFGGNRLGHWAFQPIQNVATPEIPSWGKNPVDGFLAKTSPQAPPEATKLALCRRLHFDLTGLPPTPEQVAAFLEENSPQAVERLVDQLLASPAAAIHQARWWLDLVRYADTTGYDWDEWREESWKYRDYVVRSFQSDLPYHQFITEQIAGDLLEKEKAKPVATGFLRVGPWDNSSKLFGEEKVNRQNWMSDLVETTGTSFLSLTLACCKCHDHKFDALTQADYFRFQAFFQALDFPEKSDVLAVKQGKAQSTHILTGGNAATPGAAVEAGIPSYFQAQKLPGGRLALAQWIVASENPLTTRVLVNRLWQQLFGEGIVPTVDDFGVAGAGPQDPALLDWLAKDFQRQGWSIRKTMRLLATSARYRQSRPPRRLQAEPLRDALLAVAGTLLPTASGPSVWPAVPEELLQASPAFLDDNPEKTKGWYPSPPEQQNVRSLFLIKKRSLKVPFLEAFDLPENFQSCGARRVSTVAPQALTLMNSEFVAATAAAFAQRLTREAGPDFATQLKRAWQLALGRAPTEPEMATLLPLWQEHGSTAGCRVIFNLNEFLYID